MVTRTRLARAGEATSPEKGRLGKMRIEVWLEEQVDKRLSAQHKEALQKFGKQLKEVTDAGAKIAKEGGTALGDLASGKLYWDALDDMGTPSARKRPVAVSIPYPSEEKYVRIEEVQ